MDSSPGRLAVIVVVMVAATAVGVGGGFAVAGLGTDDEPRPARPTRPTTTATDPAPSVTPSRPAPSSYDVELVVGYCWVELVEVGGGRWDLAADDDGGRLTFIPAGDPRVLQDRTCE